MYFLTCVDYLLGTNLENSKIVLEIQNCHTITTSIICGAGLLYYTFAVPVYSAIAVIPYLQTIVIVQCSFDLFLTNKPDIFFHHLVAISMCYLSLTYLSSELEHIHLPSAIVISSELSSFFLVMMDWSPKWVYTAGFLAVFYYTRIHLFVKYYLFDDSFSSLENPSLNLWAKCNMVCFLCINIYWCGLIAKKIYKEIRSTMESYHTHKNIEFILQFTYGLCPLISLYTYRNCTDLLFLVDIFGQVLLVMTSYYYHNALFKQLKIGRKADEIDLCNVSIFSYYISDIVYIQFRTFSVVAVNLLQMRDVQIGSMMIYHMVLLQFVALYFFCEFSFDMRDTNQVMLYTGKKTWMSYALYIPFVITTGVFYFHNNDQTAANHVLLSSVLIAVNMAVKPFYEMNHLVLHMLLYYQTYALSAVNVSLL